MPKVRSNSAHAWNYFEICDPADKKAICKYCNNTFSYKSTITNLKLHLKKKHVDVYEEFCRTEPTNLTKNSGNVNTQTQMLHDGGSLKNATLNDQQDIADSKYGQYNSGGSSSGDEWDPLKHKQTNTATAFNRKHFVTLTSNKPPIFNDITEAVVLPQQFINEDDDEYLLFCKLVAIKLRKVPQERRDFVMFKINEVFHNESQERHELTANNDTTVE